MMEVLQKIKSDGLVVIIRGQYTQNELFRLGESLVVAGISVLEVTLNTPNALAVIGQLRHRLGREILVGAGSVRRVSQWQDAFNAGAQFTVAPNLDLATVETAVSHNYLHLPGVFTATEAETAHAAGSKLLKLFPANVGGPTYLKSLCAPLDDLNFVPTGGISADNATRYRKAGAFALGVGSAIVNNQPLSQDEIKSRVQRLRQAWNEGG